MPKMQGKEYTILELKKELTEKKKNLKAMKKIEELQNANKRKNRLLFKKSNILKDLQNFTQVCTIMEYLCGFIIKSIKRQKNCSISGEIHLLPVRTTKQAKISKKSGKKPSLSIENCLFLTLIRLDVGLTKQIWHFVFKCHSRLSEEYLPHGDIISLQRTFTFNLLAKKGRCTVVLSKMF